MGPRATTGQARWLAPLAVAALAIAILIVLTGSEVSEKNGNGDRPGTTAEVRELTTEGEGEGEETSGEKHYVVQPGDTLSSIALDTGVPVEELQALNPDIDPQALASGERLKLR